MGLFTWIKGLGRRGFNTPLSFDEWLTPPPPKTAAAINRHLDREIARRRGSNLPSPGSKPAGPAAPPTKPQPTGGRLIYTDRDPGPVNRPVPPRLPGDLADLPVLTAQHLDGAAVPPAPAEVPSDELMSRWREECRQLSSDSDYAIPASSFMAERVVAWARQQQAESFQLPPPGADPVASDKELLLVARSPVSLDDARRAIYERGRADERTAILRALGVQP